MNNLFLKWLQENIERLFTKSPLFFVWWQRIAFALLLITSVPEFLQMFEVELGPPFNTLLSKAVMIASASILWMSRLAAQSTPAAITSNDEILEKPNETKLPFSTKVAKKQAIKPGGILSSTTPTETKVVTIKKEL